MLKLKVKKSRALNETSSQSYGVSLAIWDRKKSVKKYKIQTCYATQVNTP